MLQRFKILIGLCVFLLIGLFVIQLPFFQSNQSFAEETPTETPVPTETPIPTDTPTPTPTPFYFGCEGLTCKKIAGSSSDTCNPLHENQSCYSYTWSPIPPNWSCNVSCGPGSEYRDCLCSGGAQECCPECSSGYGCDSQYTPGSGCCVSQAPNFPTITEIKDGYGQIVYQSVPYLNHLDKLQTKIVTIKWSFTDTGDGCWKSWGYFCSAGAPYSIDNSDSFKIKINSTAIDKNKTDREYTTNNDDHTLIPDGSATIKVCANNGSDSLESCATVDIVKAIPTGYVAGYLGEYDSDTGTSYGTGGNDPIKLKLYVGAPWATPPPYISTDCTVTTESRYVTPKPNSPINPPPKPISTFYSCTITYDSDLYPGGDIPQSEFIKKFFLGPASSTAYDNKLYCVNPTPQVDGSYLNCSICLDQADCTSTEAMSCSDINPTTTPPYQRPTPTPILVWTSAGSCREDTFTGEMNFNQNFNSLTPTPDVIRYKNIVFQINQHNTFFKQKNTAFQSHSTINNHFPATNNPFSLAAAEDDGNAFMIIGEPDDTADTDQLQYSHLSGTGLILSDLVNGSASVSKLGWINKSYSPVTHINANDYYDYTKARKKYSTIVGIQPIDITHRGCYIHEGNFTYSGEPVAPYPIVFITNGTVTIEQNLTPSSSIIFIAPKIIFNNEVNSVKGVFIANEISVVSEKEADGVTAIPESYYLTNIINKPLLVTGNLVALDEDKPIKYWLRKLNDNRQPSLFVKFDVEQYTDGMPCLGVSKYKWNQLQ